MHEKYELHEECSKSFSDTALIANLINQTNINQQDQAGNTPLHYAVIAAVVNVLLKNGADQRVFDLNSYPPLFFAAAYNDKKNLLALISICVVIKKARQFLLQPKRVTWKYLIYFLILKLTL